MLVIYFLTIAPELTLQDSGELVTGAYYAAIPHPPGYPVWTIYSWLWTVLVPVGNIAWRAALGQVAAGVLACGLVGLMVSRGSSMFMEGIEELKAMTGRWENAICLVAGFVAGLLVGLDGFMWSESIVVNRISVFGLPWLILVLLCLLRWIYAPHQMRYVYWAAFLFGVCFTIHQSLIVSALGIEIALVAGKRRLGRDVLLANSVIYMAYNLHLAVTGHHLFANLGAKPGMLFLFHLIGIASILGSGWLAVKTAELLSEWKPVVIMGLLWVAGASFYFYMPLTGMTNPPMQWGYPRTVEGFYHALSRGQYEQPNPTNILADPGRFVGQLYMLVSGLATEFNWVFLLMALVPCVFYWKMGKREKTWLISLVAFYICQGVLLTVLFNPTPDRASSDLLKVFFISSHMVVACLIGYGLALIAAFMATHYAKFRLWGLLGGGVAAVVAVLELWTTTGTHYFGRAGHVALSEVPHWVGQAFAKDQYGLPIYAGLLLIGMAVVFLAALAAYRHRGPLAITLGLFLLMPLHPALSHWFDSEQREHMFGYWFGHDMFTPPFQAAAGKPLYPEMTKDAVLFGGTDPGRFCPTYMIFCESFTPHHCQPAEDQKFDRRDVYIITQNALADGTYLNYIRAHYNRSKQIDPPFFQELVRSTKERAANVSTNLLARILSPLDTIFTRLGDQVEKRRRIGTSWFNEKDFLVLPAFAAKLRPQPNQDPLSQWLYENLDPDTQKLLTGPSDPTRLSRALASGLNRLLERELKTQEKLVEMQGEKQAVDFRIADGTASASVRARQEALAKEIEELAKIEPLFTPGRFQQAPLSTYLRHFIAENPRSHTRIRLNRLLLEESYPEMLAKSIGGVYPDREIYIPSPEDSQECFNEYMADVQRRLQMNPPQRRPGEEVTIQDGRIQVSGQVAVMSINALLTKVIFDHNPTNEFFVEESFPLDWMYPYLTPFGIIMKINRQPLPTLTKDILDRDHEFWKQYSKRLTGDILDYDTPLQRIVEWIEKTYMRRNFNGFTGDRKFVRDDEAQKAFSKLRSAIAGIYAWRLNPQCPVEYRPKTEAETELLFREAEFAFRQAFLFCPFSPEAVFRYVNLLAGRRRFDEALLIAQTCLKFDPENKGIEEVIGQLNQYRQSADALENPAPSPVQQLEQQFRAAPGNIGLAQNLANAYLQVKQPERAAEVLDTAIAALQTQLKGNPANHGLALSIASLLQQRQRTNEASQLIAGVIGRLEPEVKAQPTNLEAGFVLAQAFVQGQKSREAIQLLDGLLRGPNLNSQFLVSTAQLLSQLGAAVQLEMALSSLTRLEPERAEVWFDLAGLQAMMNKTNEAMVSLEKSLALYRKRSAKGLGASDLVALAAQDQRFAPLRPDPRFTKLLQMK